MSSAGEVKDEYGKHATTYESITQLPIGIVESELIKAAIGDATGQLVLDLGGGSGLHAREAIDAGALRVDIVDVSPDMLRIAEHTETQLGRQGRIRTFEADVSQDLSHLELEPQYDMVMANWVFDHAGSMEILEGMWRSISSYLKPGGTFLCIRVADPHASSPKIGASFENIKTIPGGVAYTVRVHTTPPFEFEAASMEASYGGSTALPQKYGLIDTQVLDFDLAASVRADPSLWAEVKANPFFVVVTARKA